jgi:hypothetical protein
VDPQAEYTDLIQVFGGKVIKISPGSDSIINPFDLLDQTLDEKKLSLLAFFRVLLGELTEAEAAILDDAMDHIYEDKGITSDPKTWNKEPPVLEDLYNEVLPLTRSTKEIIYKPAMAIVNRLKSYVFGPMRFLNQQTKISIDNRMISFDIRDAPEVGKGVIMFLILEYVYTQMKKSKTRKMLVIDEAWTVLSAGDQSEYILKIVKTCRKFNLSLVMLTQDVEDVLQSRAGRAVLTNTATKILMRQDTSIVDQVIDQFNLNRAEQQFMSIATMGRALLIAETTRVPIYIQASPEEYRLITTRPDELLLKPPTIIQPQGVDVVKELDVNKRVQLKSILSDDQIKYLTKRDFEEVRVKTLDGVSELFMIYNDSNNTDEHFVLQNLVMEEIKKYTDQVLIHNTKLPDVTFETGDGRMVGVEIVAGLGTKKAVEQIKSKLTVLSKYDDHFIVSDDPLLSKEIGESGGFVVVPRNDVQSKIASYF